MRLNAVELEEEVTLTVKLYSLPSDRCVKCYASKLYFRNKNIDVQEIMLDGNPDALKYVQSLGYTAAPVVVVEHAGVVVDHWSDFRKDKIAALNRNVA